MYYVITMCAQAATTNCEQDQEANLAWQTPKYAKASREDFLKLPSGRNHTGGEIHCSLKRSHLLQAKVALKDEETRAVDSYMSPTVKDLPNPEGTDSRFPGQPMYGLDALRSCNIDCADAVTPTPKHSRPDEHKTLR